MELTLKKVNQNFLSSPEENIVDENAAIVYPVLLILAAVTAAGVIIAGASCSCSCNCFTSAKVASANQGSTTGVINSVK